MHARLVPERITPANEKSKLPEGQPKKERTRKKRKQDLRFPSFNKRRACHLFAVALSHFKLVRVERYRMDVLEKNSSDKSENESKAG